VFDATPEDLCRSHPPPLSLLHHRTVVSPPPPSEQGKEGGGSLARYPVAVLTARLGMATGVKPDGGGGTRPHPHPLGLKPPITRTHHPWRVLISPTPAIRMGNGYPSSNPHPPRHVGITPHYEASPSTPPLLTVPSSLPTQLPHRRY
jgi:hypothetical protein